MQYWLLKSEPDVWSLTQQEKVGAKGAIWDGVRNYQARNNLKKMRNEIYKHPKVNDWMIKTYGKVI